MAVLDLEMSAVFVCEDVRAVRAPSGEIFDGLYYGVVLAFGHSLSGDVCGDGFADFVLVH